MNRRQSTAAFTLVELLVVISIIALLISILLPGLSQARESAKSIKCLSNQHQLYQGVAMYLSDHKAWYPTGSGWGGADNTNPNTYRPCPTWARNVAFLLQMPFITEQTGFTNWGGQTQSYYDKIRNNSIFQCPTDNFPNAWQGRNSTSYRWNAGHNEVYYGFGSSDYYTLQYGSAPTSWGDKCGRVREPMVKYTTSTVMLGETNKIRNPGNAEYDVRQLDNPVRAGDLHNKGGNYLFGDGHAKRLLAAQVTADLYNRYMP